MGEMRLVTFRVDEDEYATFLNSAKVKTSAGNRTSANKEIGVLIAEKNKIEVKGSRGKIKRMTYAQWVLENPNGRGPKKKNA